ncbi:MAG: S-methyl-5'-thioadenosine phosphorylase [Nanoarchaeota archaeon]|nr:S-methyl-5'-thioadenosine phosphorylase [Nanoarchaeota archaeon]MBU1051417.1 S-methyl-5'-thioadenosine phosphorylase [Nanoarchaeota archaeon]MBU1988280.1 S-methyl-5'-thioadenosine phosphorylase [Nanoarchaeota archaeon]
MKIGIIGGSGLDDPNILQDHEEKEVDTPYGITSSKITCGKISGTEVCILSRHGKFHEIPPSQVNFRANIYALNTLGCTHILTTSAVGSLKEEIKPGDLVFPDQFIDFTKHRKNTFHDTIGQVKHTEMAEPFSKELRNILIQNAEALSLQHHKKATIVVIEGPRFSTKAESHMFRNLADIIGMTTVPECTLAKELGLEYASIAMSTDYDCWKQDEEPVTFEIILERMKENADKVKKLLLEVIPKMSNQDENFIKGKIRTIPNFPKPGILFRDITTLLADPEGMQKVIEIFYNRYKNKEIDVIAAIESRGFILGGILADKLKLPLVPIKKPGKLPGETVKEEYSLEYGTDCVEVHKDAISPGQNVLIIDDLLATGGTACAACNLIKRLGGKVAEVAFIVELPDLKGRDKLSGRNVFSIVRFDGE